MSASNFELSHFAFDVENQMIDALGTLASFYPNEKGNASNSDDLNTLREKIRGPISVLSIHMYRREFKSRESQNETSIVVDLSCIIEYMRKLKTAAQQLIDADNKGQFKLNPNEKTFYDNILASVQGWIEQLENHFPNIKEQNKAIVASSSSRASAAPFKISSSLVTVFEGAHPQLRNSDASDFELSHFVFDVQNQMIDALGTLASFYPNEKGDASNSDDLNTLREKIRGPISVLSVHMYRTEFKSGESQNEKSIVVDLSGTIKYMRKLKTAAQQLIDADNKDQFKLNPNEKTFYDNILASVQGWIEQLESHFPSIKEQNKAIVASSSSSASAAPFNISSSSVTVFGGAHPQRNRDASEERKPESTNFQR